MPKPTSDRSNEWHRRQRQRERHLRACYPIRTFIAPVGLRPCHQPRGCGCVPVRPRQALYISERPSRERSRARAALAITVLFVLIAILARTAEILIFIPIFLVGILVYIAPTLVAQHRGHPAVHAIFILNLFGGWTFIGWLGAMVWANTPIKAD